MKIFAAVTAFAAVVVAGVAAYEPHRAEYHAPARVAPHHEYHAGAHREYAAGRAEYRAHERVPNYNAQAYNGYRGNGRRY
ncbi:hypothetical protein GGI23_001506 [Coemansia sp. RSA 2559]|nr:hypothetical protein GGI23_001506 [Coemansia sp. RSA 2559]KAJ2861362.1 hypothetical protein GGI22_002474 [Coemansia erecta]